MMMAFANVVHNTPTPISAVCSTGQFRQYQPFLAYRAEIGHFTCRSST